MARRLSIGFILATLVLTLIPGIATASVTGDCTGEATIKGVTYTPANDTPGTAIPIPDEAGVQVIYSGSVGFENQSYSGSAKVQVGPFSIKLGDTWSDANEQDLRSISEGVYELDDFRDKLPVWIPGVWKVSATHNASGGQCSGFAMIKLAGNPLSTAVGWVVLVGTLGLLYAAIWSITKRQFVGAALASLLFGGFLALALMMWAIRPLDTSTVIVMPVVLSILAILAVVVLRMRHRPA